MAEPVSAATWIRFTTGVADQAIAATAQSMHRAITDANFRWVGPLGRPVQAVHDVVLDRTWGLVRGVLRGAGAMAAAAADGRGPVGHESTGAAKARAIAIGSLDTGLVATAPGMDPGLALVAPRPAPVAVARRSPAEPDLSEPDLSGPDLSGPDLSGPDTSGPDTTGRLVVFVHGLVDTEDAWTATTLPDVVRAAGATPLLVRYGSGRPVAANGTDLSDLLETVVADWPVPVDRLVVVAHSMGGLVVRAAAEDAHDRGHAWPDVVSEVVHLATPHLGSWLEKVANITSWTLRRASPRSAPIGALLDRRSRGIKDLRFGTLAASDGASDDLLAGRGEPVPWPDEVTHHLVVGRLRPGVGHPLNLVLGDGLVRTGSATGRGRRWRIPDSGRVEVVEVVAGHNRLADHPDVALLLSSVLAADSAPARSS